MYISQDAGNMANDASSVFESKKKSCCCCSKKVLLCLCCLLLGLAAAVALLFVFEVIDDDILEDLLGFDFDFGDDDDDDDVVTDPPTASPTETQFEALLLDESVLVDGVDRNFTIFVPASYFANGEADAPLMFVFHGLNSNRDTIQQQYALEETAERENFIAVFPDSLDGAWDAFAFPNNFGFPQNRDLPFVEAMLDFMKTEFNIKEESVYSTGHSLGALFTNVIACFLSNDFAAVAPIAGGFVNSILASCIPSTTPHFQIHGTADPVIPITGLDSLAVFDPLLADFSLIDINVGLGFWAVSNGLEQTPIITPVDDVVSRFSFPVNNTVQHLRLEGIGHFMPELNTVVNVIEEVVAFFKETTDF